MDSDIKDLVIDLHVILIIVTFLLSFIISLKLYLKLRSQFLVKVNCWFCNQWTKIPFKNSNSFECPTCLQYNGFDNDGNYNKEIPEQHNISFNQQRFVKCQTKIKASNGLCAICNNNQQLKVYQLANFVPMVEENYDVEIKHFQKQLDKACKLCSKCNQVLKKTIIKQNASLCNKFFMTRRNDSFNLNKKYQFNKTKQLIFINLLKYCIIGIACLILIKTFTNVKFNNIVMPKWSSFYTTKLYVLKEKFCNSKLVKIINENAYIIHSIIAKHIQIPLYSLDFQVYTKYLGLLNTCGLILQSVFIFLSWNYKIYWMQLFAWIMLNYITKTYLKIITLLFIIASLLLNNVMIKNRNKHKRKKIEKYIPEFDEDLSDCELTCENTIDEKINSNKTATASENSTNSNFTTANLINKMSFSDFVTVTNNTNIKSKNNDLDIHTSLNNLHLSGFEKNVSPDKLNKIFTFPDMTRPKPILSPSKFEAFNQKSWVAGGFWHNNKGLQFLPTTQFIPLSRSSSQSSGFISHASDRINYDNANFNSLPASTNNSACGDHDRASIFSEPLAYPQNKQNYSINFSNNQFQVPNGNTFYPIFSSRQMLYISSNTAQNTARIYNPPTVDIHNSFSRPRLFKPTLYMSNNLHNSSECQFKNWAEKMDMQKLDTFSDLSAKILDKPTL